MKAYIVNSDLLISAAPVGEWHATPIPADPTQSLVMVKWNGMNEEIEFESRAGVLFLGDPWESLPPEAVPLLASLQDPAAATSNITPLIPSVVDGPAPTETVGGSLRKVAWSGARFAR